MKTRTELLNYLAAKYGLKRYLEIGVQNKDSNFNRIICESKTGVDPDPEAKAHLVMTSDAFFDHYTKGEPDLNADALRLTFDLVFIDGLHHAEQVKKDVDNALNCLNPGGFIVLHDCLPVEEKHAKVPRESKVWNGDTYRFIFDMVYNYRPLKFCIVDIDHGCGVIQGPGAKQSEAPYPNMNDINWHWYQNKRADLPIVSSDQFTATV